MVLSSQPVLSAASNEWAPVISVLFVRQLLPVGVGSFTDLQGRAASVLGSPRGFQGAAAVSPAAGGAGGARCPRW